MRFVVHVFCMMFFLVCGQNSWANDLVEAAGEGDVAKVTALLKKNVAVDTRGDEGNTALIQAVREGSLDVVRVLVEHKADVNAKNEYGYTPLLFSTSDGDWNITKFLLENKADVHVRGTSNTDTPLLHAAHHHNVALLPLLIQYGANIHDKTETGSTALHVAASGGRVESVQLLLDKGLDINARNKYGNTPLIEAVDSYIVRYNHHGAVGDYEGTIKLLLENKADPNIKNSEGYTALDMAKGFAPNIDDIVEMLQKYGAKE